MIDITYHDSLLKHYYTEISKRKFEKEENQTLLELYDAKLKEVFCCELEELLCGSFEKLDALKDNIGRLDDITINTLFNYASKFQPIIAEFFMQHIEVHTCYYCNIESINVFKTFEGRLKNGFTLDHVIAKADYPYLALSLYNLVPACYTCNTKLKGKKELEKISPTSATFDFDEKVKFKTFMESETLQIESEDSFALLLKEDFSEIYEEYIRLFELEGRYEYYKYKVLEMINKRKEYPDSRIKELAILTQKTEEEVKQDLFGEYLFKDEGLHKRPLSKLIKDISKELDL